MRSCNTSIVRFASSGKPWRASNLTWTLVRGVLQKTRRKGARLSFRIGRKRNEVQGIVPAVSERHGVHCAKLPMGARGASKAPARSIAGWDAASGGKGRRANAAPQESDAGLSMMFGRGSRRPPHTALPEDVVTRHHRRADLTPATFDIHLSDGVARTRDRLKREPCADLSRMPDRNSSVIVMPCSF